LNQVSAWRIRLLKSPRVVRCKEPPVAAYRYKNAVEDGGAKALLDADRRGPTPKNRVEPKVEAVVRQYAIDLPVAGVES